MNTKNKTTSRYVILSLIALLCISLLVISIIKITSATDEYAEGSAVYDDLTLYVSLPPTVTPVPSNTPDSTDPPDTEHAIEKWPIVDFKALSRINPDVVACFSAHCIANWRDSRLRCCSLCVFL